MRTVKSTDTTPVQSSTTPRSGLTFAQAATVGVAVAGAVLKGAQARELKQATTTTGPCSVAVYDSFTTSLPIGVGCTVPYTAITNGVCQGPLSPTECATLTHGNNAQGRGNYIALQKNTCPTFPAAAAYPSECGIAAGTSAASAFNPQDPATYNLAANDWVSTDGVQKGCHTYEYNGNNCRPLDAASCAKMRDVRGQLAALGVNASPVTAECQTTVG